MIEVVRGGLEPSTADELLAFWAERGALFGEDARRRLPEVVCVLRRDGALAGASSVHVANVELIGGRRFWMYRDLLSDVRDGPAMLRSSFEALHEEFDGARGSPIGLCVLLPGPDERRRRPEAEWSDPRVMYAGYLSDGRQVRIAYFDGAVITRERSYG
jgi:hypothetical protein